MSPPAPIPEGFERVACPGCDGDQFTVAREGRDWYLDNTRAVFVVRCNTCGLHYTNPRPSEAHVGVYYPQDYPPHLRDANEPEDGVPSGMKSLALRYAFGSPGVQPKGLSRALAAFLCTLKSPQKFGAGIPYHGRGRLLDFGCGNGKFLRRMASLGWDVTGLDIGQQAVDAVRASGLRAIQGTLPHPDLQARSFDVITMRQSLEHVHNPRSVLAAAYSLLSPNGLLLVNVPNYDSWEIRYFGDASLSLQLPRHLLHFTPDTLANLLRKSGFSVLSMNQICRASWIKRSLTRTERRGERRSDKLLRNSVVRNVVARYQQSKGAGNDLTAIAQKI
jgi:SAM-dependent methyltransferase